jgi:hypothetical protein
VEFVTNGGIREMCFFVDCVKHLESILETKANELKSKAKYTKEDLATLDFTVAFIQETANLLKRQRDEMNKKIKDKFT